MDYETEMMLEELMETGMASGMASNLISSLLSIAVYVLTAWALYDIAKRRGINKPWLAWIPVANVWIIGCISDQYRYVVKNQVKSKRKVLLTLDLILVVLSVVMIGIVIGMVVNIFGVMFHGSYDDEALLNAVMGPALGVAGLSLPLLGISIAYMVVYFMALYDVYCSLDPNNSTLYLVLSILFSFTTAFFLFFNRQKDLGMPPRRPEPTYDVPPVYQEPAYQEPTYQEPTYQEPVYQEPTYQEPFAFDEAPDAPAQNGPDLLDD